MQDTNSEESTNDSKFWILLPDQGAILSSIVPWCFARLAPLSLRITGLEPAFTWGEVIRKHATEHVQCFFSVFRSMSGFHTASK